MNKTLNGNSKKYKNSKKKRLMLGFSKKDTVTALFFPFAIIFYELIFKIAVGVPIFCAGSLVMLLYAFFAGGILYLISTVTKKALTNRIIGASILLVMTVPYLVQYFVHKAFKVFYDLNTLFGGAGDVMQGFTGDIVKLVFSFDGLSKICVFFLPAFLYLVVGGIFSLGKKAEGGFRMYFTGVFAASYLLVLILVCAVTPLRNMQGEEYNFQTAVENVGLLRSMRLDMTMGGSNDADVFENINIQDLTPDIQISDNDDESGNGDETPSENTEAVPEKYTHITDKNPKKDDYGYNSLDIDYMSLAGKDAHKKLNAYVASLTPSKKNPYTGIFAGKNLIFITGEAFSAEAIDPELTPTLYRMATKGINFTDYYQPASAGTTGGEYQNIFGYLPMSGGKSFKNMADNYNYYTMGSQLDRLGYYGKAYHNNDYKYYDRHKTHITLGYSDGYMGYGNGMEEYVKKQWPQSDHEMLMGTLPTYIDKQPFNIYYMSVSGHGVYSSTGNSMSKKHWSRVSHLEGSEAVKGYIAANLDLEDAMTYLIEELEAKGIADNTVVVISADHFPYGLEDNELSELYGYTPESNLQRDHSRLIIWCGELEKYQPIVVSSPTFSLDILPTLSNLFGTEFDSRLMPGRDVFSDAPALVFNTGYEWKTDYGTYSKGQFVPKYPDIELPENYVKNIKSIVSNKILYCRNCPDNDYFRYLFG